MRIFLDANILFSAAKSRGAVRAFLSQLRANGHILVADGYVADEARRNLKANFPAALEDFEDLMQQLESFSGTCQPMSKDIVPRLPEKDRPVLAAAIHYHCQILLTGDKTHFGSLYGKVIEDVAIHSPASLAEELFANGGI